MEANDAIPEAHTLLRAVPSGRLRWMARHILGIPLPPTFPSAFPGGGREIGAPSAGIGDHRPGISTIGTAGPLGFYLRRLNHSKCVLLRFGAQITFASVYPPPPASRRSQKDPHLKPLKQTTNKKK